MGFSVHDLGRTFISLGLILMVVGVILLGLDSLHVNLGHLPGDFNWHGHRWSISFPLATCILVSVLLSALLWVIGRFHH